MRNNRSVVVRVNDRGPFIDNRIIDLSYSAALKLDMVGTGTSLVEVEAIGFDKQAGDRPTRRTAAVPTPSPAPKPESSNKIYVQIGAFGSRENAQRQLSRLRSGGIGIGFIKEDASRNPPLYRVRLGPIKGVLQYDILVEELENMGIMNPYLVTE